MDDAADARAQCMGGLDSTRRRIACWGFWGFDAAGCSAGIYKAMLIQ